MMDTRTTQADSERSSIGIILVDGEARERFLAEIKAEDYTDSGCRSVYQTMLTMANKQEDINIVSVSLHGYDMASLCEMTTDIIPATYQTYANIILTAAAKRRALSAANNLVTRLNTEVFTSPDDVAAELNSIGAAIPKSKKQRSTTIYDAMLELPEQLEQEAAGKNLKYGWRDIDGLSGGLWPGEFSIIAAGPGTGKTAFALNIAENTAKQSGKILFVSLEMSITQLSKRLCSMEGIESSKMRRPQTLTATDWAGIPGIAERLSNLHITFDGTKTIQELQNRCTRLRERDNLDLLIIDYLQLMRSATKTESRRHEVEFISRALKLMALELNMPIIALSQLSREGQRTTGPTLNDLRESGSLEQDADNVVFLFDPKAKENLSAQWLDISVIAAKQRSGQTGKLTMRFDKRYMKFYDIERR
jgi:replicative DNA helicase